MRICKITVCTVLSICFLISTVFAAGESSLAATASLASSVPSILRVRPDVTEEDAAERLYYLGLMSGVGMQDGRVNFALERPLTKLECLVMAIRLTGVETDVLETRHEHPFTDVPEWGSPYVGYFYEQGLLVCREDTCFAPDTEVSTAVFMKYMLNALGYTSDGNNYSQAETALIGQRIGICTDSVSAVTRGDAALMMYRTLDTTVSGSDQLLSYTLVQDGILNYQDVQFLLWNEDHAEVDAYIASQGYSLVKSLREGKYTITLAGSDSCLNVLVNGANNDYEGVRVTTWTRTGDISQQFRVEATGNGTYHLHSCASGGGFRRMLGMNAQNTAALYSKDAKYAGEFILQYADANDGSWHLLSAADPTKAVSAKAGQSSAVSLQPLGAEGYEQCWAFQFDGVVNEEGYELALYPAPDMNITQGYYDDYSHQKQNALDITTKQGGVYAPFSGSIVRIDRGYSRYNTVWLESADKVVYADGSVDYMTVVFMHDNNVSNLFVGQVVSQGEYFYDAGVAGGATGPHVHVACIRGRYKSTMSLTGSGDVYPEDAMFVPADTQIVASYGLDWVFLTNLD